MAEFKAPTLPARTTNNPPQGDPNAQPLVYNVPFWSERPPESYQYSLEVIFDGSVQQRILLNAKPFYLVGRAPICDIMLDNDVCQFFIQLLSLFSLFQPAFSPCHCGPKLTFRFLRFPWQSISRQHAVIQFRKTGEAFLYDLGSTHGTLLNGGVPIAANAYKRIMAGDSIRFGKSSRLFVFEGGPDREEVQVDPKAKLQEKLAQASGKPSIAPSQEQPKPKAVSKPKGNVVSVSKRRFSNTRAAEDDEEEMDAEARLESQLSGSKRGSKAAGNASDEESDGNVSDEERDNAELEMVAEYLGREALEGADGEDAFYDRTLSSGMSSKKSKNIEPEQPENVETLEVKIRVLKFVLKALHERVAVLQSMVAKDSNRRTHVEEDDALDAFMAGMSQTVEEEEELTKKQKLLKIFENELSGYLRMSILLKDDESSVKLSIMSEKELDRLSDIFYNGLVQRVAETGGSFSLTSKALNAGGAAPKLSTQDLPSESTMGASASTHSSASSSIMNPPDAKRPKVTEVAASDETTSRHMTQASLEQSSSTDSYPSMPPPTAPAAHSSVSTSTRSTGAILDSLAPSNHKKRERVEPTYEDADDTEEAVVWQAPQGQSGDGRTSLNAKFGY